MLGGRCHDELAAPFARYRAPAVPQYTLPAGVRVRLVDDAEAAEAALAEFAAAPPGALGLDTEWADASSTVALLQLASREAGCLVLRMQRLRRIPVGLEALLMDESKLKCGVAVANDLKLLERQFGLSSRGFVDLQPIALRHGYGDRGVGLAAICRSVLGAELNKSKAIRQSDWSGELTQAQLSYAACDAFVAVDIIEELHRRYGSVPRAGAADFCDACAAPSCGPSPAVEIGLREWCAEFVDRMPKGVRNGGGVGERSGRGGKSKAVVHAPKRTTALYGGCRLLGPDGLHLANVSAAKAGWYVDQGLGERVVSGHAFEAGTLVVRLTFQPKGVGHAGDEFYLQTMENRCVACGSDQEIIRFSIVPHVFRSQLPLRFKEHSSHDICLLCHDCFVKASDAAQVLRRRYLRKFDLSEASAKGAECPFEVDQARVQAKGAAVALRHPRLPPEVRGTKEAIVREYLGKAGSEPLTEEDLDTVRNLATRLPVEGYISPEVKCATMLGLLESSEAGNPEALEQRCFDFVVSWRQCFLDAVQPRCLPAGWDVHRSIRKHDDLFGPLPPHGAAAERAAAASSAPSGPRNASCAAAAA